MKIVAVFSTLLCVACMSACTRHEDEATYGERQTMAQAVAPSGAGGAAEERRAADTPTPGIDGHGEMGGAADAVPLHAAADTRFPALLHSEKPLLEQGGLSASRVAEVIRTPAFNRLLAELEEEVARDPLAQDVTTAQRRQWERWREGQATLHAFACGLSLCVGTVRTGGDGSGYALAAKRFLAHGPPGSSLGEHRVDLGNGLYEHRFVMTHDPAVKGVLHRWPLGR